MPALGAFLSKAVEYFVVLGIVVVFHELGHFIAAKLIGVRVDVFSFGFGRRLAGWKRGETDYRISLVPLGGYVRMHGDGTPDERTGSAREFDSRRPWEKLLILFMGPAFNVVLAIAFLAAALMTGLGAPAYLSQPARVEFVEPGSPAEAAGIRSGDLIHTVDGKAVPDWETFQRVEIVNPGAALRVGIERQGVASEVVLHVAELTKHAIGHAGVYPCHRVVVQAVNTGSVADRAGLRAGDAIQAIGGQPTCRVEWLVERLQAAAGAPVTLTVLRGERQLDVVVAPRWNDALGKWVIGIAPAEDVGAMIVDRKPPLEALEESASRNWRDAKLIVVTLGRLVTGRLSLRNLSGPMELASFVHETVRLGIGPLLQFVAFISLFLGISNLIPVPVLDGGRIALILVEAVRGRELEQRTKEWVLQIGLVMILVLTVVVVYLDLVKSLEG